MKPKIRKLIKTVEETRMEFGRDLDVPIKMIAMIAVFENPWAGQGYVEDLRPVIRDFGPQMGDILVPPLIEEAGGADKVEAYGKASIVGLNGEIEHASGLIHTLFFGNKLRDAVEGTSYLSFTNLRGTAGCDIQLPMMHLHDAGKRSHYITMQTTIADAPMPDEVLIALGVATSGRPFPRIGDRYKDMEEMKWDPSKREKI